MKRWALLMGAGDLASRLAPLLKAQDYDVVGARRTAKKDAEFEIVKADARRTDDWLSVLKHRPAVIVLTLTPAEYSDDGYRTGYVEPCESLMLALAKCDPAYRPFIVFVSSTSVYGQRQGEWVTEQSDTQPASFAGTRLLEAERHLTTSGYPHTVIRFSGIYGPGREGMLARLISGEVKLTPAWTNRIHVEDCVGVIAHLIARFDQGSDIDEVYLATDDLPVRQADFADSLAAHIGIAADSLPVTDQIGPRGSKRCSNARLRESGYRFRYPTWKEGYEAL